MDIGTHLGQSFHDRKQIISIRCFSRGIGVHHLHSFLHSGMQRRTLDSDRQLRCILTHKYKCLVQYMSHRSDTARSRLLQISTHPQRYDSIPMWYLPMLQVDPFHPLLHVQVFGVEQIPLIQDEEQIAVSERSPADEEC